MSGESDLNAMTALCEALNVTLSGMDVPFTGNVIKVYGHEGKLIKITDINGGGGYYYVSNKAY